MFKLFNLCYKGNIEKIKKCEHEIKKSENYNINYVMSGNLLLSGYTCVMLASDGGYLDIIKLLIDWGADINIVHDISEDSCLIKACNNGYKSVVEYLLSQNVNLNHQNIYGDNALMCACKNNHYDIVELLLQYPININTSNRNKNTSLIICSIAGYYNIAKSLLACNPNINIQNNEGNTALICACKYNNLEMVKLLLKYNPNLHIKNNNGETCLRCININIVSLLLEHDHSDELINTQDNDGNTELLNAIINNNIPFIKLYLEYGVDLYIKNNDNYNVLTYPSTSEIKYIILNYLC